MQLILGGTSDKVVGIGNRIHRQIFTNDNLNAYGQSPFACLLRIDVQQKCVHRSVKVEFAGIADAAEREFFLGLPTSLALPAETVDRLRAIGGTLLSASPQFQQFLRAKRGDPAH